MTTPTAPKGQHGGARSGAGRPPGTPNLNRQSREDILKARESGKLPHEILLEMARSDVRKVPVEVDEETGEVTYKYVVSDPEFRKDAAKAAAPYYAPKLSAVETIAGVSDDELREIAEQAERELTEIAQRAAAVAAARTGETGTGEADAPAVGTGGGPGGPRPRKTAG